MTRTAAGHASVAQANEIGVHLGLAALVRQAAGNKGLPSGPPVCRLPRFRAPNPL